MTIFALFKEVAYCLRVKFFGRFLYNFFCTASAKQPSLFSFFIIDFASLWVYAFDIDFLLFYDTERMIFMFKNVLFYVVSFLAAFFCCRETPDTINMLYASFGIIATACILSNLSGRKSAVASFRTKCCIRPDGKPPFRFSDTTRRLSHFCYIWLLFGIQSFFNFTAGKLYGFGTIVVLAVYVITQNDRADDLTREFCSSGSASCEASQPDIKPSVSSEQPISSEDDSADHVLRYTISANLCSVLFSLVVFLFVFGFSSGMGLVPILLLVLIFSFIGKLLFPLVASALFAMVKCYRKTWFYKIAALSFVVSVIILMLSPHAPFVDLPTLLSSKGSSAVYVTEHGAKYHLKNCNIIKTVVAAKPISLEEATAQGYTPCMFCDPDTLDVPKDSAVYLTKTGSKYHTSSCDIIRRTENPKIVSLGEALAEGYEPCSLCNRSAFENSLPASWQGYAPGSNGSR